MIRSLLRRRLLLLALLPIWAPAALAFPPCPQDPVETDPLDGPFVEGGGAAHRTWYTVAGDAQVLAAMLPDPADGDVPGTGNCRTGGVSTALPGPDATPSDLVATPTYSPRSAIGALFLPDLREESLSTSVLYRLDFGIANASLPAAGDWVDVLQFEFRRNDWPAGLSLPSTYYRLRVRKPMTGGAPLAEVIEVRREGDAYATTGVQTVVATIPLNADGADLTLALRWFQINRYPGTGDEIGLPIDGDQVASFGGGEAAGLDAASPDEVSVSAHRIDSTFEIVGAGGVVHYSTSLPDQWAHGLSMGLIDYHSPSAAAGTLTPAVDLTAARIGIEQ